MYRERLSRYGVCALVGNWWRLTTPLVCESVCTPPVGELDEVCTAIVDVPDEREYPGVVLTVTGAPDGAYCGY